jgi:hypothetical protein
MLAAGLIAVTVALTGCFESFRPAQPQPLPGSGGGETIPLRYDSPETTLATIEAAVTAKGAGNAKSAYLGGFANPATSDGVDFTTTFDPLVVERLIAENREVPVWDYRLEGFFYSDFVLLRSAAYAMRWTAHPTAPPDVHNTEDATLHRRYHVILVDDAGNNLGWIARGLADLYFRRVDGDWVIVRWEDHLDPDADPNDLEQKSMGERRLGL